MDRYTELGSEPTVWDGDLLLNTVVCMKTLSSKPTMWDDDFMIRFTMSSGGVLSPPCGMVTKYSALRLTISILRSKPTAWDSVGK